MECHIPAPLYPVLEVPSSDRSPETAAFLHIMYSSFFSERPFRRYVIKATDGVIQ
jgi:hypothetical protein